MKRFIPLLVFVFLTSCAGKIDSNKIPLPEIITPSEMYPTKTPIIPTYTITPTITISPTVTLTFTSTPNSRYYDLNGGFSFIPPPEWVSDKFQYSDVGRGWKYTQGKLNLCSMVFNIKKDVYNSPQEEARIKILSYSKIAFLEFLYEKPFPTEYFPNGYTFSFRITTYSDEFYQKEFIFLGGQKVIWPIIHCGNKRYPELIIEDSMRTLRIET